MSSKIFKSNDNLEKILLSNSKGLKVQFLKINGALFNITYQDLMINLSDGHQLEGSIQNIYLRLFKGDKIKYTPLLGPESNSVVSYDRKSIQWQGSFEKVNYLCRFLLAENENIWFWDVELENTQSQAIKADVIYFQDKGIAARCAIKNNEFYTSHYIDNKVFETKEHGYVIASRQNQSHCNHFPWLLEGSLNKAIGFATDAVQFYGTNYKINNIPLVLTHKNLPNLKLQAEFAVTALQSQQLNLPLGEKQKITFFAFFKENHEAVSCEADLDLIAEIETTYKKVSTRELVKKKTLTTEKSLFAQAPLLSVEELTKVEIAEFFGKDIKHKEEKDGQLLSFFTGSDHVMLPKKESLMDRPQGHIIHSGLFYYPEKDMLSSTNYMYGCFHAQITIGNTSFNQLLSHPRSFLNLLKSNGQRIFVSLNDSYYLLGVPSAYVVGVNSAQWIYKTVDHTFVVKAWTDLEDPVAHLEIDVMGDANLSFLIFNEIVLGANEYEQRGEIVIEGNRQVTFLPARGSMIASKYPEAKFFMSADIDGIEKIGKEELLFSSGYSNDLPCVVFKTKEVNRFRLTIGGSIETTNKADTLLFKYLETKNRVSFGNDTQEAGIAFKQMLKNFNLFLSGKSGEKLERINDILVWYLHNAMIHFSSPHGLEQYSGAAWGVRDVLQGSVEFLLAIGEGRVVREILKTVFSHQFIENGDWPQWFMFDEFKAIQDDHSHGDIIIWPIKAVAEYIEYTNDFSILEEKVPYTKHDNPEKSFTTQVYTIAEHLEYVVESIESSFIEGTSLPCYGDGDWDDTLQPANQSLKKRMVSGWTAAIAYQYLNKLLVVCKKANIAGFVNNLTGVVAKIKLDYRKYIIKDDIVSGFIYFNEDGSVDHLLHPTDLRTSINYRLLPMTRCMLAEIFTKEEAKKHYELIKQHLRYMDGVRLMDKHAPYNGGVSTIFKRAEQAAYCGREIGLLYVHAHLRYIEAMIKIGEADEAYLAILQVTPISIVQEVKNAQTRQSNCYFSSCDIDFTDRYQAQRDFAKIKKGELLSKGGWRIYSSGPGIYLHQIINNFLGLRCSFDDLVFDPVIPKDFDNLTLNLDYDELRRVTYVFKTNKSASCGVLKVVVNGQQMQTRQLQNPYRKSGVMVNQLDFEDVLTKKDNIVEIILG